MSEIPREVFAALLDSYEQQHTFDDYPISEQSEWPAERAEWLARFDAANTGSVASLLEDVGLPETAEVVREMGTGPGGWRGFQRPP